MFSDLVGQNQMCVCKKQKSDDFEYWNYLIFYLNEMSEVSHNPEGIMNFLEKPHRFKEEPVNKKLFGKPTWYLK